MSACDRRFLADYRLPRLAATDPKRPFAPFARKGQLLKLMRRVNVDAFVRIGPRELEASCVDGGGCQNTGGAIGSSNYRKRPQFTAIIFTHCNLTRSIDGCVIASC